MGQIDEILRNRDDTAVEHSRRIYWLFKQDDFPVDCRFPLKPPFVQEICFLGKYIHAVHEYRVVVDSWEVGRPSAP